MMNDFYSEIMNLKVDFINTIGNENLKDARCDILDRVLALVDDSIRNERNNLCDIMNRINQFKVTIKISDDSHNNGRDIFIINDILKDIQVISFSSIIDFLNSSDGNFNDVYSSNSDELSYNYSDIRNTPSRIIFLRLKKFNIDNILEELDSINKLVGIMIKKYKAIEFNNSDSIEFGISLFRDLVFVAKTIRSNLVKVKFYMEMLLEYIKYN